MGFLHKWRILFEKKHVLRPNDATYFFRRILVLKHFLHGIKYMVHSRLPSLAKVQSICDNLQTCQCSVVFDSDPDIIRPTILGVYSFLHGHALEGGKPRAERHQQPQSTVTHDSKTPGIIQDRHLQTYAILFVPERDTLPNHGRTYDIEYSITFCRKLCTRNGSEPAKKIHMFSHHTGSISCDSDLSPACCTACRYAVIKAIDNHIGRFRRPNWFLNLPHNNQSIIILKWPPSPICAHTRLYIYTICFRPCTQSHQSSRLHRSPGRCLWASSRGG